MNRREFGKALAGIPLLGLLAKLPRGQGELNLGELQKALGRIGDSARAVVPCLRNLGASVQEAKHWLVDHYVLLPHLKGGQTIFVDLVAGDDANDGLTPETAVTWEGWLPLVETREEDMVICFCPDEEP